MPSTTNTSDKSHFVLGSKEQLSLDRTLEILCQGVLNYAKEAKVQKFRYYRSPLRSSSPQTNLQQAIEALSEQLAKSEHKPTCQTQAIDFLRELAFIGHQQIFQNTSQQKAASFKIHSALLELY